MMHILQLIERLWQLEWCRLIQWCTLYYKDIYQNMLSLKAQGEVGAAIANDPAYANDVTRGSTRCTTTSRCNDSC